MLSLVAANVSCASLLLWHGYFNSRPREGANGGRACEEAPGCISIPAPARGRTRKNGIATTWHINFNSRPREGANNTYLVASQADQFQFPPPRGGELGISNVDFYTEIFQFPPPRGGELSVRRFAGKLRCISIPAPARGRTEMERMPGNRAIFQFPPPRGGEQRFQRHAAGGFYFNSRPREGANRWWLFRRGYKDISIPAPARGRTVGWPAERRKTIFQFPPPRGGEPANGKIYTSGLMISIPAPARGRTPTQGQQFPTAQFQFPPPRGGERKSQPPVKNVFHFNSRPREGANMGVSH